MMFMSRTLGPQAAEMPVPSIVSRTLTRMSRRRRQRRELAAIEEQHPETFESSSRIDDTQDHDRVESASDAYEEQQRKRGFLGRGMDRLRRSIRHSLRRRKSPERPTAELVQSCSQPKSEQWQPDESAVRAGICSFQVKYLGALEVFESRGMHVCEGALKLLRAQKRRPVKAVLYVSGDGLRVVDQENNRGLLVDQTIEKVSFCAPDRNNSHGFAYICRDGATRRWMCHGFQAVKESGERLSHAVGCAFSVCLEKKKKRDEETSQIVKGIAEKALNPDWDDTPASSSTPNIPHSGSLDTMSQSPADTVAASPSTSGFQKGINPAYNSFRKVPISERLQDPQAAIVVPTASAGNTHTYVNIAKPRPVANPLLFQRQGSLRAPEPTANFRRQWSLRPTTGSSFELPSKTGNGLSLFNEPIYEGDEEPQRSAISRQSQKSPAVVNASSPHSYETTPTPYQQQSAQSWINPESTGSSQAELIQINSDNWTDLPCDSKKADDWLENALRNINISPPIAQQQTLTSTASTNGHYANIQSCVSTAPPPPIPMRPAISKDAVRVPVTANVNASTPIFHNLENQAPQPRFDSPETIQWEKIPAKPVKPSDDPFDVQWSRMALSEQINS